MRGCSLVWVFVQSRFSCMNFISTILNSISFQRNQAIQQQAIYNQEFLRHERTSLYPSNMPSSRGSSVVLDDESFHDSPITPQSPVSENELKTTSSLKGLQTEEQQRVLDTVAHLRKCGLENTLPLPQLVVCGDQSAGKSEYTYFSLAICDFKCFFLRRMYTELYVHRFGSRGVDRDPFSKK